MTALTRGGFLTLLVCLSCLFLLDTGLTLYNVAWLQNSIEVNPVMAAALERGPIYFLLTKLTLSGCFVCCIWHGRHKRWVQQALLLLTGAYSAVLLMNLFVLLEHLRTY
jgi:hypothetical protein